MLSKLFSKLFVGIAGLCLIASTALANFSCPPLVYCSGYTSDTCFTTNSFFTLESGLPIHLVTKGVHTFSNAMAGMDTSNFFGKGWCAYHNLVQNSDNGIVFRTKANNVVAAINAPQNKWRIVGNFVYQCWDSVNSCPLNFAIIK